MNNRITLKVFLDNETVNSTINQINYIENEIQKLKKVAAELNSCISNLELQIK